MSFLVCDESVAVSVPERIVRGRQIGERRSGAFEAGVPIIGIVARNTRARECLEYAITREQRLKFGLTCGSIRSFRRGRAARAERDPQR